jgi:hypothetical protein
MVPADILIIFYHKRGGNVNGFGKIPVNRENKAVPLTNGQVRAIIMM